MFMKFGRYISLTTELLHLKTKLSHSLTIFCGRSRKCEKKKKEHVTSEIVFVKTLKVLLLSLPFQTIFVGGAFTQIRKRTIRKSKREKEKTEKKI